MKPYLFKLLSFASFLPNVSLSLKLLLSLSPLPETAATAGYAGAAPVTAVFIARKVSLSHFEFCKTSF